MELDQNSLKAEILVQALPYIQKFWHKTVVIKYGGNAMINDALKEAVISDVVLLSLVGIKVVLVHGGGPEISEMLKKVGKESKFINGLRYTDRETMDIVQMILGGKVNKDLVTKIQHCGGAALGLSGLDGSMLKAKKLSDGEHDYGFVGEVTEVNPEPISVALQNGYIPVVATIAEGEDGQTYNINADTAAAKIAVALGAEKFILLTDVNGILREKDDPDSRISELTLGDLPALIQDGTVAGGMIPKVKCCIDAMEGGVERTHILDGRVRHSIVIEMLSDEGVGTMIRR